MSLDPSVERHLAAAEPARRDTSYFGLLRERLTPIGEPVLGYVFGGDSLLDIYPNANPDGGLVVSVTTEDAAKQVAKAIAEDHYDINVRRDGWRWIVAAYPKPVNLAQTRQHLGGGALQ